MRKEWHPAAAQPRASRTCGSKCSDCPAFPQLDAASVRARRILNLGESWSFSEWFLSQRGLCSVRVKHKLVSTVKQILQRWQSCRIQGTCGLFQSLKPLCPTCGLITHLDRKYGPPVAIRASKCVPCSSWWQSNGSHPIGLFSSARWTPAHTLLSLFTRYSIKSSVVQEYDPTHAPLYSLFSTTILCGWSDSTNSWRLQSEARPLLWACGTARWKNQPVRETGHCIAVP